jgi:hypothetical protein
MALFAGTNASEAIRPDLVSGTVHRSPAGARPSGADDVINGGGGDDSIAAGGGNDIVVGGIGDDDADLGSGDDIFRAKLGDGYDDVEGGVGFDSYEWRGTDGGNTFEFLNGAVGVLLGGQADGRLNGIEKVKLAMGAGGDDVILYHLPSTGFREIEIDVGAAGAGGESDGIDYVALDWGDGDDRIVVGEQNGRLTVSGSDLVVGIDNLTADDGVRIGTRSGNDVIDLTGLGADAPALHIDGASGDDLILPGLAAERITGGTGNNIIDYGGSPAAVVAGFEGMEGSGGWARGDTISNYRTLGGSDFNDVLAGTSANNVLLGRGGGDLLRGFGGNDILNGGAGDDALSGGDGEDRMVGGAGNDIYYVENAGDTVVESANGGIDRVVAFVSTTLVANVETLFLYPDTGPIDGTGNGLANDIEGNDHDNALSGEGGGDTIRGESGNDLITGDGGADLLYGGDGGDGIGGGVGNDMLEGGAGRDRFTFDTAPGAGNVDTIEDFTAADDTIYLKTEIFGGIAAGFLAGDAFVLGTSAQDAEDRVVYDQATGRLFFDADGAGGAAALLFARVDPATELSNLDFRGY